ncbi:hypothetical protein IGI04_021836 [Brassica rapa subsp. trilocularis]|uniref:FAD-binding PCMH-type domain-containing protein n=1 Tax=Brassica rapa subsp. trilocularis TaxID=1813537 RepID=A0ABQ7M1M1_BRACM|nr:hypothetical protein IGI04_021836 [Brassica rapa subsp. trilocularis]
MKLVCLISFFFFISTTSLAAVSPPNPTLYQNFLQCFSNQTKSPPNSLSDVVLPQTAPAFTPTLRAYIRNARFNTSTTSKPAIVIAARSEPHVQAAVLCTKSLNVQLKTRSGGHDYEGVSYTSNVPFFVLDMSNLRNITVLGESAWVGAGATLGEFVAPKTDPSLFMRLLLQPVTRNKAQTVRASVVALFLGKSSDVLSLLTRDFPELGLKQENCTELTWIQSVLWWANNDNATQVKPEILLDRNPDSASYGKRKSDYVEKEITKEGLDYLMRKMIEVGKTGLVFNPYGGKMSEVATTATPFPHRTKLYKVQHSINWKDPGTAAESSFLQQTRSFYSYMAPYVTQNPRHTYLNYRDLDIGVNTHGPNSYREAEVYGRKYFGENFDRLVKVKTAVDPQNFFRDEQSVPTLPGKA